MLSFPVSPSVLRATVWFDASTGVLLGAAHLLLTAQLADGLGLPASLLMGTGVALLAELQWRGVRRLPGLATAQRAL